MPRIVPLGQDQTDVEFGPPGPVRGLESAAQSFAKRRSRMNAGRILVVSGDPAVREGWARHFEAQGSAVSRCAGPEATHCALELGPHCPLLDEVDAAYYENASVTEDLAADLIKRPRSLQVFFADDRLTPEGRHEPEVTRSI